MILIGLVSIGVIILLLGGILLRNYHQLHKVKQQYISLQTSLSQRAQTQQELQTELTELKTQISRDILMDSLTGLPGRKVFEDRLAVAITQSTRYQLICGVMFLDIDRFKVINDALGHDIGDLLLKAVAENLQDCVRQVDTIGRFAGDEFVFILPQLSKAETAAYVAQRSLDAVSRPIKIQDQELYVTASIGIAIFPTDGADAKTMLNNANNALHQAKARGRNIFQFYREGMHAKSQRELILSSGVNNESIYQNLAIYYQPQVNLETKKIVCMDGSLIWQHPDFGAVDMEELLRIAENNGKSAALGEWLLRNACQDFLYWKAAQSFLPNHVCIPISLKQIENSHFIYKISSILQEMNIDPECLVLEISETVLGNQIDVIEKMLYMLKHLGVKIAITHFGAGQLSLQNLHRLPVDILKIDSSLTQDVSVNKESLAITKMIIALASSLQITLVAEGVESENQKQALKELGCHVMQGNLFSHPSLAHEFNDGVIRRISASV